MTLILLACFSKALNVGGKYGQLDAIWRLQIGLALVPALATLWPRLRMPEGKKFLESRELNVMKRPESVNSRFTTTSRRKDSNELQLIYSDGRGIQEQIDLIRAEIEEQGRIARLNVFFVYFREWKHLKVLLATMLCWFLLDVAFYGTSLNQSVILQEIGFAKGTNEYDTLRRNAIGNLIIAVAGNLPGYFVNIYFIEKLGRRWIQIQGFLIVALMFAIIAGGYGHIGTGGKFACLAFAQVNPSLRLYYYLNADVPKLLVLLQFRPQLDYLHHSRRSVSYPRPRLCPWCECCHGKTGRDPLRATLQLPQRSHSDRSG